MATKNHSKKRTPLHDVHLNLGATMIDFAGWLMPVKYESIIKEHETVRKNAGIFDISHMGEFLIEGKDAFALLQYLMTNDLKLLEPGKGQYSVMCYENGTVVDDVIYYMESKEKFRAIVNASNITKDFQWIRIYARKQDIAFSNISQDRCRIALQGPNSVKLLNPLTDKDLSTLDRFYFTECNLNDIPLFIACTGYTGEHGFELSFEAKHAEKIWNVLLKTGASPIGLGARDTLRLEACYSLYGHEISNSISPIEANMGWVVKQKEVDYIGKDVLLKQKENGTARSLVGLNLLERGIIRENYEIYKNGEKVGYVTSGGFSPTLKKTIGLGLVKSELSSIGTELEIEIRDKLLKAKVVSTPFYRNV
ncbi:MAG: glycine cleavage system aminomethyltransferase GcvT [Promethearchaeota archaeon]|nr:MAG: glycine cleavage system aminomethyltransferase GcvT [Candidatus Lokiarchaeota archaeon]